MARKGRSDRTAARPSAPARLLSDERLAKRAAGNDRRSFAEIYRRYSQCLYRFCLSIVGSPEDASDALQNTMVKALRALPGEERQIQLKPWLYRVARNESVELLRKRRQAVEFGDDLAAPGGGPAETIAQRERLSQLLSDLAELPERQRSMLTMRELAGLELAQIAAAFDTSPAVVRQTIYEARLSLRQLAEGREMTCEEVTRRLSDADGRVRRRRDIQAHLRACPDCRAFGQAIEERRHDLASLAPLPAIASAGILHAVLGGGHGAASGAAAGSTIAAGAGKVAATPFLVKSVATVAVAATVGVSAADRSGLVDVGLPSGSGDTATREATPEEAGVAAGATNSATRSSAGRAGLGLSRVRAGGERTVSVRGRQGTQPSSTESTAGEAGRGQGPPAGLPPAAAHGQQTAAEHRAERESRAKGHSRSRNAKAHSHGGASHAHRAPSKPQKESGSTGEGNTQGQPGGEKPQGPSTPSAEDPATGGPAEGSIAPIDNKSSAGATP
ncbi:MAG TPA: sigma-70 family RNA polymerase sigma factor [Solirubrobacterales bacterium]|jgi:RNA polymerase sigma factor (sigma-70 family)